MPRLRVTGAKNVVNSNGLLSKSKRIVMVTTLKQCLAECYEICTVGLSANLQRLTKCLSLSMLAG